MSYQHNFMAHEVSTLLLNQLRAMERLWGDALVKRYILQGAGVSEAMTDRVPVYDRSWSQNVGPRKIDRQFKFLTKNLKDRLDEL